MYWRLIPPLQLNGELQMAIDTWLFQQHIAGNHPPTLRFYTWSSPTISLGYHQKTYPPQWENLQWQGQKINLVRRPTGGRAVLHQGDLTYAVITSGLSSKRIEAYQQICKFLILGWQKFGIKLHYGQAGRGYIHNPNCFGTATGADLVTENGYKFIGSAQLRQGQNILQHGSMRINQSFELYQQVFHPQARELIINHSINPVSIDQDLPTIIDTLQTTAAEYFQIKLEIQPFTPQEWQEIMKISGFNIDSLVL
ncbi:lipoate--protein ligase family protein [Calothrix sp. NIES-3974]|uniref:lipoate--protein ligase family protein n=1 Tax=Calothrix sp. NIES-3974 TaxID=2005462 RepID=UPI000B60CAB7|nr:biotin/lipoate A/B protein ligase family protein [Calothrix sp. NIES-3974]BAZ07109.1 biotin/lipoate A/B protein ligase [Calothrix sp. NIES-3974]